MRVWNICLLSGLLSARNATLCESFNVVRACVCVSVLCFHLQCRVNESYWSVFKSA